MLSLYVVFIGKAEQVIEQTVDLPVIWGAVTFMGHQSNTWYFPSAIETTPTHIGERLSKSTIIF